MERRGDTRDHTAAARDALPGQDVDPLAGSAGIVSAFLHRWQTTADHAWFDRLLHVVAPAVQKVARRILWRHGVRDPGAVDDAVSLVFDHLRRLARPAGIGNDADRRVMPFVGNRGSAPNGGDAGIAYVAWLARERALDVVRRQKRRNRRYRLTGDMAAHERSCPAADADDVEFSPLLHAAIATLPPRERIVCELLLAGHCQAEIADLLGLCAGTVSRIRQRVIRILRDAIAPS